MRLINVNVTIVVRIVDNRSFFGSFIAHIHGGIYKKPWFQEAHARYVVFARYIRWLHDYIGMGSPTMGALRSMAITTLLGRFSFIDMASYYEVLTLVMNLLSFVVKRVFGRILSILIYADSSGIV